MTRQHYIKALHYFMTYLHIPLDAYDKLLEKDPKHIQMDICDFVTYLRKKGLSSASVSVYVAAVNKFYAMNDIVLNWKKIRSFMGEYEKTVEDRPYTHSEIQTLIQHASPRNKAMILLMSSAGLRIGAISILKVKDLEPIDKYNIYKISVYSKSRKSRYFSFCTPECRKSLENYIDYRKRWEERITEESPLFRTEFNNGIKYISTDRGKQIIISILRDTGLRKPPIEGKTQRSHIMGNHGFRKFFETNAFRAGMDLIYVRRLLGQTAGLEDSYLKLSEEELLEGDSKHVGFIGIIDALTIDDSHRLKRKVKDLTEKQDEIQKIKVLHELEMKSMREDMSKQINLVMEMIQQNPQLANVKPEVLIDRKGK